MKLSQQELQAAHEAGRPVVINYRTAYIIRHSRGCKQYILQKIAYAFGKLPYPKRGRFMVVSPEMWESIKA